MTFYVKIVCDICGKKVMKNIPSDWRTVIASDNRVKSTEYHVCPDHDTLALIEGPKWRE